MANSSKPYIIRTQVYAVYLLLGLFFYEASSQSIVKTLPGIAGILPFVLETGYVSVRSGDVELFYYFIESENDPEKDPLLLWLTGGPCCSGFSSLVYEVGPLAFDIPAFNGSLPSLLLNPYSWTKFASIIFIDAPVGTWFSYATKPEAWPANDTTTLIDNYDFIKKWLMDHPKFLKNAFYLAGESYGGIFVPTLAHTIIQGNKNGNTPHLNLQGYVLGNPAADMNTVINSRITYAYRMGLISDEYYEAAKSSCGGDYIHRDPQNAPCLVALQRIQECTANVYCGQILQPKCDVDLPKFIGIDCGFDFPLDIRLPSLQPRERCRFADYRTAVVWANDPSVQEALHVRNGMITEWSRCNRSVEYLIGVSTNIVGYHRLLTEEHLRVFIFNGDHDMIVPHFTTLEWIKSLNLTLGDRWRPWFVGNQVGGYTERYKNDVYDMTFATVKGGSHTPPEFKAKECWTASRRWFAYQPL